MSSEVSELSNKIPPNERVVNRPKNLLLTPDPFHLPNSPSPAESFEPRHLSDLFHEHGGGGGNNSFRLVETLRQVVAEDLSRLGVDFEFVRSKGGGKARKSPRPNIKGDKDAVANNAAGFKRTVEVKLPSSSSTVVTIPFIVKQTCDYIRQHIKQQGIFRISGVASRANSIIQRFADPEIEEHFTACDTVHDVAVVLKQYLRQLEVPLIPHSIQHVFIKCLELQPEDVKTSALLLASCLVPQETIGCLTYILQFLAEVANESEENLMTFENLGIIMGLNIMPIVDPRTKSDKDNKNGSKDVQRSERQLLDLHNKVIENLIKNADKIGQITEDVERRLDSLLTLRSSEDELENEGVGRRKKRRSGSLNSKSSNRMLGFLKKVTNSKSGAQTPITPMPHTPGGDSFSHTPIIKGSAKKNEDGVFSLHKKKSIFDGSRKSKNNEFGTPNTLPNQITCPSPVVCLDPRSPMKVSDWKATPNGNRLKNFVTPSILRRRDKNPEADKNVFSAPNKPSKPKLRFGRSKPNTSKVETPQQKQQQDDNSDLFKSRQTSTSTISIHKLAASPRAVSLQKNISLSKIPRPGGSEKPELPPKRVNLSSNSIQSRKRQGSKSSLLGNGDYVTLSTAAGLLDGDIRNDAFLASSSSISVLTSDGSSHTTNKTAATTSIQTELDATKETDAGDSTLVEPPSSLHLTPLIQEIDNLTRTAGELTLSTLRGKSASSIRSSHTHGLGHTLPESPTELGTTPLSADQVESKFIKAMQESKIIQIQSEIEQNEGSGGMLLQRRLSERVGCTKKMSMSPSQRRIVSNDKRRKSHEIGRVTPIITPTRFLSLRSPNPNLVVSPTASLKLKRSPMRCTLKRGRPNTARVGLARPSPARNIPRSITSPPSPFKKLEKNEDDENQEKEELEFGKEPRNSPPPLPPRKDSCPDDNTPIRRMSSVQELVKKLEKHRTSKAKLDEATAVSESSSIELNAEQLAATPTSPPSTTPQIMMTRSKANMRTPQTPGIYLSIVPSDGNPDEMNWVSGHNFKFDRRDFHNLHKSTDRDSIHFLKTLRAGKVPATVEYFNKIGYNRSPTKSLIPRYTALQNQSQGTAGLKFSINPAITPEIKNNNEPPVTTPSRIARRMSSVDIDIRNRNRKEELLDQIKKESAAVKRSNTTTGTGRGGCGRNNFVGPVQQHTVTTKGDVSRTSTSRLKRPTTLDLNLQSPAITRSRASSLRRPNHPQTPCIAEEDESLVLSVNRAIDHLLHPENAKPNSSKSVPVPGRGGKQGSASKTSPLKNSNIANSTLRRKESIPSYKKTTAASPTFKTSPPMRAGRRVVTIARTASENGTKSTATTPRSTPKIKKALTTRAYDMMMVSGGKSPAVRTPRRRPAPTPTPTEQASTVNGAPLGPHSLAHTCQTITPRRRVPRMGNGGVGPTTQTPSSENNAAKNKLRTPLRATHIFTSAH